MWCETQKNGTVKYCERYTDPLTEKVKKVTVTMPKASPRTETRRQGSLPGRLRKPRLPLLSDLIQR